MRALTVVFCLLLPLQALAQPDATTLARGKYLAIAGDCSACHRNPDNGHPFSGGYRISTPLGDIFATNISPSRSSGIGNYSLADFRRVMREGRRPDGSYLYPAMPYTEFASMTDDDLAALYDYFHYAVAADDRRVPETQLPFPFSVRAGMSVWNRLFLRRESLPSGSEQEIGTERGEYLVKTAGHCGSCHSPRNLLMAEQRDKFLRGGEVGTWNAPDLTQAHLADWSENEMVTYFKTGSLPGKAIAAGEMATVVERSLSQLSDSDLHSIARYLRTQGEASSQPPVATSRQVELSAIEVGASATLADAIGTEKLSGAQLYNGACASCHGAAGEGSQDKPQRFPRLAGAPIVTAADPANLIMTVAEGVDRTTPAGHAFMPAFASQMSQPQLTRLLDYVSTHFGVAEQHVSEKQVAKVLHHPKHQPLLQYAFWIALCLLAGLVALVGWRYRSHKTKQQQVDK